MYFALFTYIIIFKSYMIHLLFSLISISQQVVRIQAVDYSEIIAT